MLDVCPFCGELIFTDTIEVKEINEEFTEETLDDIIADENIVTRSVIKGIASLIGIIKKSIANLGKATSGLVEKIKKKISGYDFSKLVNNVKEIIVKKIPKSLYKGLEKIGLIKILKKITYERTLGIAIIISTACLLVVCIKDFIYLDKMSEVARVNKKTTTMDVKKLYDVEPQVKLDVTDRTIAYIYDNQKFAEINDCTIYYKVNPNNNKVAYIRIEFDSTPLNISKMRSYLDVNYGAPIGNRIKEEWNNKIDDVSYVFSNGVHDLKREYVLFKYLNNMPSIDDVQNGTTNVLEKYEKEDKKDNSDAKDETKKDNNSDKKEDKISKKDKEEKKEDKKKEDKKKENNTDKKEENKEEKDTKKEAKNKDNEDSKKKK